MISCWFFCPPNPGWWIDWQHLPARAQVGQWQFSRPTITPGDRWMKMGWSMLERSDWSHQRHWDLDSVWVVLVLWGMVFGCFWCCFLQLGCDFTHLNLHLSCRSWLLFSQMWSCFSATDGCLSRWRPRKNSYLHPNIPVYKISTM